MNKFSVLFLVFLMLAFVRPAHADEHFPYLAEVSKESVNVRAGPNTNFEKLDKLTKGAKVVVLGRNFEWLKVQPMATIKAYIRSDYLLSQGGGQAIVSGDRVNVRCRPNSDAATLGEVKKGTLVAVKAQENGWSSLAPVPGTAAWIHQDFLMKVSDQVPASMLISSSSPAPVEEATPKQPEVKVSPWTAMRGRVAALVQPLGAHVHYEMVMDDHSVFLLQDIPHLEYFCNTEVTVEGSVVPDPQKKYMYPVLQINKISLVL